MQKEQILQSQVAVNFFTWLDGPETAGKATN